MALERNNCLNLFLVVCICLFVCPEILCTDTNQNNSTAKLASSQLKERTKTVKKDLNFQIQKAPPTGPLDAHIDDDKQQLLNNKMVVISERTLTEQQQAALKNQREEYQNGALKDHQEAALKDQQKSATKDVDVKVEAAAKVTANVWTDNNNLQGIDESVYKRKLYTNDTDIPDFYSGGVLFFGVLSILAILFVLLKFNRMRFTRAELKYGVQGDRTTQELTPLPVSVEDGNSDDEDHTLFQVSHSKTRTF